MTKSPKSRLNTGPFRAFFFFLRKRCFNPLSASSSVGPYRVSIHSQNHPPTDSFPADRSRVDCPLPEGKSFREGMPGFVERQVKISLKGEASDHKGIFGQRIRAPGVRARVFYPERLDK
jgi:hypothetical protein